MNTDNRTDKELNGIIGSWMGIGPREVYETESCDGGVDVCMFPGPPNYCRDISAVHGVEETWCSQPGLEDASHPRYRLASALYTVTVPFERQPVFATARQRVEALVRVIEESKQ